MSTTSAVAVNIKAVVLVLALSSEWSISFPHSLVQICWQGHPIPSQIPFGAQKVRLSASFQAIFKEMSSAIHGCSVHDTLLQNQLG